MFTIRKLSITYLKSSTLQTLFRNSNYSTAKLSAATEHPSILDTSKGESKTNVTQEVISIKENTELKGGSLVAQAFASLHTENYKDVPTSTLSYNEKKINDATTVNELLSVVSDGMITRQNALKIVSVLAQWSTSGKVNLSEFETDPRFVKICRILSRPNNNSTTTNRRVDRPIRGEDLSMVLGVAGDDEAAKLVASITLPQMVKVMSQLSHKKRRSTPLLRALAYNISRSTDKLDLKQCGDLLYSMALLNFPDPVLLERIGNDITEVLNKNNDRTAVVGSILTSIGLMRYKEPALLEVLSEWILKHNEICRPQDIFSLILTLGTTNYQPEHPNLFKVLVPQLNISDTQKPATWLDLVWSLVILNQAKETHILSVLNTDFIEKLQASTQGEFTIPAKAKLLNINAAVKHLMPGYKGPLLKDVCSEIIELPLARTKDKQTMVSAVLDSLNSLLPSATYLRSNVDTKMGFYIDGICTIDKKCNPLPVEDPVDSTKDKNINKIRVAIMVYDFHDMCRGTSTPHGGNDLAERLLVTQGYKIMKIPYNEFNPRDKVVQRVQYLEKHLKQIASTA